MAATIWCLSRSLVQGKGIAGSSDKGIVRTATIETRTGCVMDRSISSHVSAGKSARINYRDRIRSRIQRSECVQRHVSSDHGADADGLSSRSRITVLPGAVWVGKRLRHFRRSRPPARGRRRHLPASRRPLPCGMRSGRLPPTPSCQSGFGFAGNRNRSIIFALSCFSCTPRIGAAANPHGSRLGGAPSSRRRWDRRHPHRC